MLTLFDDIIRRQRVLIFFSVSAAIATLWAICVSVLGLFQAPL